MSELSEAIARAEKRLEGMSKQDRERCYVQILREELNRPARRSVSKGVVE